MKRARYRNAASTVYAGLIGILLAALTLAGITGCQPTVTHTLVPVEDLGLLQADQEAPDDIMPAPGLGPGYRANFNQQGIINPWPSIEVAETLLGSGRDEARIVYRHTIVTSAGEACNNVVKAFTSERECTSLFLYADAVPQGFTLTDGMQWGGARARASVLVIEASPDMTPGEFTLDIGLLINGKDYGTVPCIVEVTGSIAGIAIEPEPGSFLCTLDEPSRIVLEDVNLSVVASDRDYSSPWFPAVKKSEPLLIISGHVRNMDAGNFELSLSAEGYDEAGEVVAGTLDAAHIAGAIGLHLEYEETGEFILHMNYAGDISTIRISAAGYPVTPP